MAASLVQTFTKIDDNSNMVEISDEDFENMVEQEFANIPKYMRDNLENVLIVITDQPVEENPRLYGLYSGHPITKRGTYGFGELPDQITLFKNNMQQHSFDLEQLRKQIKITLVHEIGHYFGLDDQKLHELGWG